MSRPSHKLAYSWYYSLSLLLVFAGILVSAYLTRTHYLNFSDPTYASFCAISRSINCDTVAQSPWSVYAGIPVAHWGLLGYVIFFLLLLPLSKENCRIFPIWKLLQLLALIYTIISLLLAYISSTKIHSFCILCIASYAINFILLFLCWLICKRFDIKPLFRTKLRSLRTALPNKKYSFTIIVIAALFFLIEILVPPYWRLTPPAIQANIPQGVTPNGHPWMGAKDPALVIEEFADYQCFQCYKMHTMLRQLIQQYPQKIRLVHRHYPMDHEFNPIVVPTPFHVGSGKMALLAIYAMQHNKFWEMNDALYHLGRSKSPFNTKYLAEQTNIPAKDLTAALQSSDIKQQLNFDILVGMKKRITATPSYIINDQVYTGFIPQHILDDAVRN